jgi:nucleotide-binding universal stress UspA family protein
MIKKVLVATDGSDHAWKAIELACEIAVKYVAVVYPVHVGV